VTDSGAFRFESDSGDVPVKSKVAVPSVSSMSTLRAMMVPSSIRLPRQWGTTEVRCEVASRTEVILCLKEFAGSRLEETAHSELGIRPDRSHVVLNDLFPVPVRNQPRRITLHRRRYTLPACRLTLRRARGSAPSQLHTPRTAP
jgi:hypothetical protein